MIKVALLLCSAAVCTTKHRKNSNQNSKSNFYFVTCFYSLYDICMVDKKTFLMTDLG